jgi:regulator of RNase E activity RraA
MATDESALFARIDKELYTAVVHDVLDEMGYRNQTLPANLRPLDDGDKIAGRAATMLAVEVADPSKIKPFGFSLEFLDGLHPGEVVVGTAESDAVVSIWGEIMSTAAKAKGARGVILNGYGRDSGFIKQMGFPAFFTGLTPTGSVGRLEIREVRTTIKIGGVTVNNGDLILADHDGCLVVPRDIEQQVLDAAFAKVAAESKVRAELQGGANITAMYEKYGVL